MSEFVREAWDLVVAHRYVAVPLYLAAFTALLVGSIKGKS